MIFATERLVIRNYRDEDRAVFAAIGRNPLARVYHRSLLTPGETDAFIERQIETVHHMGCGYAAVERKADGVVVGDVGIRYVPEGIPFSPDAHFDIGWQLDPKYFGKGYASEAARGWLDHGFRELRLDQVVAYAAAINIPSISVMKRIGMIRDPARDFDHPKTPKDDPLSRQIVYSISNPSGKEIAAELRG